MKVDDSRLDGVSIARLRLLGVCRYLENVSEVIAHVFCI